MNEIEAKYNELKLDEIGNKPSDRELVVSLQADLERERQKRLEDDRKKKGKGKQQRNTRRAGTLPKRLSPCLHPKTRIGNLSHPK